MGAGGTGRLGKCPEIDMGGEVGLAGSGEGIVVLVPADGLEGVAGGGAVVAIVDDEGGAAVGCDPAGEGCP